MVIRLLFVFFILFFGASAYAGVYLTVKASGVKGISPEQYVLSHMDEPSSNRVVDLRVWIKNGDRRLHVCKLAFEIEGNGWRISPIDDLKVDPLSTAYVRLKALPPYHVLLEGGFFNGTASVSCEGEISSSNFTVSVAPELKCHWKHRVLFHSECASNGTVLLYTSLLPDMRGDKSIVVTDKSGYMAKFWVLDNVLYVLSRGKSSFYVYYGNKNITDPFWMLCGLPDVKRCRAVFGVPQVLYTGSSLWRVTSHGKVAGVPVVLVGSTVFYRWISDLEIFYLNKKPFYDRTLGQVLMEADGGVVNRFDTDDPFWKINGRFMLTHIGFKGRHDYNGFDAFDVKNAQYIKLYAGLSADKAEELIMSVRGRRGDWKLHSIFNSEPVLVSNQRVVYFLSDGGMLHAFRLDEEPVELWVYIPEGILSSMFKPHRYVSGGYLSIVKAGRKTLLVGSSGKENAYIFAIDVTVAESPEFLWEINRVNHKVLFEKVGSLISSYVTGYVGGRFVGIFPTSRGYLLVVDLADGSIVNVIKGFGAYPTGVTAVKDNTGRIGTVYVASAAGGIYRVVGSDLCSIKEVSDRYLFFCRSSLRPIVAKPAVAKDSKGNLWVFFGTGNYTLCRGNYPHQKFYAVVDGGKTYCDAQARWMVKLGYGKGRNSNERLLKPPFVYGGYVFFTTYQPVCNCTAVSYLYVFKFDTGEYALDKILSAGNVTGRNEPVLLEKGNIPVRAEVLRSANDTLLVAGGFEKLRLDRDRLRVKPLILFWRRTR